MSQAGTHLFLGNCDDYVEGASWIYPDSNIDSTILFR